MNEFDWILDQLDYVPPHRESEEFEKELREALWIMGHTREDIDDGTLRVGVRRIIVTYRKFKQSWENVKVRPWDISTTMINGRTYE